MCFRGEGGSKEAGTQSLEAELESGVSISRLEGHIWGLGSIDVPILLEQSVFGGYIFVLRHGRGSRENSWTRIEENRR